jgi:glycosyltransferase involved in cell wall biosynthesis
MQEAKHELKISVLIPTYNQAEYILDAVQSALNQSYTNKQVIVANDNSTDNTKQLLDGLNNEQLTCISNASNLGRVANYNNTLYKYCNGNYTINLDGDDYFIDNDFFKDAAHAINSNTNNTVLFYQAKYLVSNKKTNFKPLKHTIKVIKAIDYLKNIHIYGFGHGCTLFNTALAKKTNFYIKNISSSDMDSFARLCIDNPDALVILSNKPVYVWRQHSHNTSGQLSLLATWYNYKQVYYDAYKYALTKPYKLSKTWLVIQMLKGMAAQIKKKLFS